MTSNSRNKKRASKKKVINIQEEVKTIEINPENRRVFESARDHLNEASIKNTEAFDKAILSLSSAGLVISLTFTKFIAPLDQAVSIHYLQFAWICFALAMISTVTSFLTSNSAIAVEREHIYKYYMEENDDYINKANYWGKITYWINRASAILFIVGMLTTVLYVWQNTHKESTMADQEQTKGYVPPIKQPSSPNTGSQVPKPNGNANSPNK